MIDRLNLPTAIGATDESVLVRRATLGDLQAIMRLLLEDSIGAGRRDVANDDDRPAYAAALDRVIHDPANELVVAVNHAGAVVGTLQLTVIPGMARRGSARLLIEAVRVASSERSSGIGTTLMRWVVELAAIELETPLVQLTSHSVRKDAHRFYRRLGFVDSHVGFKFHVTLPGPATR
ncbi:GNAT family N-acetyltransferase [Leifsonia aquatica]|uniref:GNAT family N-acetyltransferase n=1 Tax=Leifsonia aquatica TaxID=144185 RepID=UPI0038106E8B